MDIYYGTKDYRKIYERHYGVKIGRDEFGRKHEIHHIDGNHNNNDPLNLMEVNIQEHYDIHYSQGDWGACQAMALRMKLSPEEISKLSSSVHQKRVNDGTHHMLDPEWQIKNNPFFDREWQKMKANKSVADGTHPFLGPENNAKRVEAGSHNFLGPITKNHPSQVEWTCQNCGKVGKGSGAYTRYHGDNCRQKILCL